MDFLKKIVIIQWNVRKKYLQLFATRLTEKIPDPSNTRKYYNSYLKGKNTKSITIEHWKTLRETKEISQVGRDKSCNSSLYSETIENENFFN